MVGLHHPFIHTTELSLLLLLGFSVLFGRVRWRKHWRTAVVHVALIHKETFVGVDAVGCIEKLNPAVLASMPDHEWCIARNRYNASRRLR